MVSSLHWRARPLLWGGVAVCGLPGSVPIDDPLCRLAGGGHRTPRINCSESLIQPLRICCVQYGVGLASYRGLLASEVFAQGVDAWLPLTWWVERIEAFS